MTKPVAFLVCQLLATIAFAQPSPAPDSHQAENDELRREVADLRIALDRVRLTNQSLTADIAALTARLDSVAAAAPALSEAPRSTPARTAARERSS